MAKRSLLLLLCLTLGCLQAGSSRLRTAASGAAVVPPDPDARGRERRAATIYIVGGEPAPPNAWPFVASLLKDLGDGTFRHYCGGTLVADRWILTAAHCPAAKGDVVIVGRSDLKAKGGVVGRVVRIVRHPAYDPDAEARHDNDIALVRIGAPGAPALPKARLGPPPSATTPTVTVGWGALWEGDSVGTAKLHQVTIDTWDLTTCKRSYAGRHVVTDNMVCASRPRKDSCQGDSGGPLLHDGNQIGVVSFGEGCARDEYPGVYTRVESYRQWIDTTIR